jgi:exopolyphosphatase/guanosine-5'-triphosphate,3'-diphosphate pyrophosphatase
VVDAHWGAAPVPARSEKSVLRLAERITKSGELSKAGSDELVRTVATAKTSADKLGCEDLMAFVTSAVREADNSVEVLARVAAETGVELRLLSGADEARLTFLAARRWYGWSAGRLLVLDIGGGSLEIASGIDEDPDLANGWPTSSPPSRRRWPSWVSRTGWWPRPRPSGRWPGCPARHPHRPGRGRGGCSPSRA